MGMHLGLQKYGTLPAAILPCQTCQTIASTTPLTMLMARYRKCSKGLLFNI